MKRRFTILTAALALLVSLAIPMGMWGQTSVTWPGTSALPGTATAVANDQNVTIKTSSTNTYTNPIRIYANTTVTINALNGAKILSVAYEASSTGNYVTYAQNATVSPNVTSTVSGKIVTWTYTESANVTEFTFTPSSQTRSNGITITYKTSGGGTPTTYTVTYDANGGTGTMTDSNSPYNAGATVTVMDNTFTRDNYTFSKWNTVANGSGTDYVGGNTFNINANTTLYAQWTEQSSGDEQWVLTSLTDLTSTDVFVIVGGGYAMTNNNGTGSAPSTSAVTITGNKITSNVTANIKWNVSGNATNGYTFYPNGSSTTWLYCSTTAASGSNNNMRVGTGDRKVFELNSNNYLITKDNYTVRYLSIYNSSDWRGYVNTDNGVVALSFYKKVTSGVTPPSISANNVNIAYGETNGSIPYTINDAPTPAGSLSAVINAGSTIANLQIGTITSSAVPFTCDANTESTARTATVTLTYTYGNNETVTQTVTITQAAVPIVYTTIPALFAAATSDETPVFVTFNNWVVSGVSTNGKSVYVTDNTGNGFVIYFTSDMSGTFAAGYILSGTAVACKLKLYNGAAELVNLTATDLTITSGGTVSIFNIPMSDLSGVNTGALVSYDNLTCSMNGNNYILSDGTTTLQAYNTLYAFNEFEADKTYNVTGVYVQYNSIKEIAPRSAADIQEVQVQHNEYTLTVGNPAHITLTVGYGTDGVLTNGENDDIEDGTEITVTVNVETGYLLDEITVSGTNNQTVTVTETSTPGVYTFYMPAFDATLTATAVEYVAPAAGSYVRITSLDQLTNGSKVIIAARYNSTANAYAAMPNVLASNTNHGKPNGVAFTSTISGTNEVLPDAIVNEEATYYWTVGVNDNVYTFTSANGNMIGWAENTDFSFANGAHKDWTVERVQAGSGNMVSNYTGFLIKNQNTTTRAFAYNGSQFGAYSTTANLNNSSYNFFLDFFVQDEPQTYTKDITGWSAPGNNLNFYLIASPIGDVNPTAVTIEGDATATMVSGSYDLYYFDHNRDKEWVNYIDASNTPGAFNTLESGKGYLYANLYDVTLVFRGTGITSGEQTIPLDYYEEGDGFTIDLPGWNLLGNPFAKTAYLTTSNSGITTSFYTMDEKGNYISVTNGSIDAMEGIFVHAVGAGQSVTFTTTAPSKSPVLNLNLSNGRNLIDRAIIRFDRGNQLPKLQFRQGSTKVYIPVEGQDYAVVNCEEMGELPVSFKAEENGSYNLSLSSEEVSFAYLHLIDNMTGADVDLLQTPSYSFEAKTTDYESRFKLVFATGDNSNDDNFAFFSNGSFVINNDGEATLQVIDVTGRILSSESINGCTNVNVNAASGVYMLRLINGDNVKVQKVVVK